MAEFYSVRFSVILKIIQGGEVAHEQAGRETRDQITTLRIIMHQTKHYICALLIFGKLLPTTVRCSRNIFVCQRRCIALNRI